MKNILVLFCVILSLEGKGVYSQNDTWSSWLACDPSCGEGLQSRYRNQCPVGEENCNIIESRRCNGFDCSKTSTLDPSTSSATSPLTTTLRGESLLSSSNVPSTHADVQEKTSELTTTLLTTYTPKRSTTVSSTTTTTTTAPPKLINNSKSTATRCHLNLFVTAVLCFISTG